ncbi:MAG TPA: hypothetical protein VKB09_14470 [Thermomicrobiales bacterium]|nr:hypothetical protein [Thermomicrobiales bacterium]
MNVSPRFRNQTREDAEDIYYGQVVTSWARWFNAAAAVILVLWSATTSNELARNILPVIGLVAINFFMHGRTLMERPANQALVLAASLIDVIVITAVVAFWHDDGLVSPFYVLYYPAVFAFALVMAPRLTAIYAGLAMVAYVAACAVADVRFLDSTADAKLLVMRLITLAATATLGAYYYRVQRQRRRSGPAFGPREETRVAPRPIPLDDARLA